MARSLLLLHQPGGTSDSNIKSNVTWIWGIFGISSDRGSHFTAEVLLQALGTAWDHPTAYRPRAIGKLGCMNDKIKLKLGTTRLKVLTQAQALPGPRSTSNYDLILHQQNQPLWAALWSGPQIPHIPRNTHRKAGVDGNNYLLYLNKTLQDFQGALEISRPIGLDTPGHEFQPGDWVCWKDWGTALLQPKCRGTFQVPLTTSYSAQLQKKSGPKRAPGYPAGLGENICWWWSPQELLCALSLIMVQCGSCCTALC